MTLLTDDDFDALDTFSLHWMAPRNRESVRKYGRAVEARVIAKIGAQPASAEQATVQPTTLQNAIAWGRLYDRAQALCAEIGYAGSVSTDDDEVELLMDALHAIDGGEWMPGLLPAVAAPAPSAEQQPVANRDTPALHEAARLALDALALARPIMDDELAVNAAIDALRAAIGEGEGN